jgi:hypothetical protein
MYATISKRGGTMRRLWILGLVFILFGCMNTSEENLNIPSNIRYEDEMVYWDQVENASYYTISINGIQYRANTNQYDVSNYENGTYTVRVKANNETSDSIFSNAFNLVIDRLYDYPKNVSINQTTLNFDGTDEAVSYNIYLNETVVNITETSYDLSQLESNAFYLIGVSAVYDNGESNVTDRVAYHTYTETLDTIPFEINKNRSTNGFIAIETVYAYDYFIFEGTLIDEPFITFETDTMIIDYTFLRDLDAGTYTITLILDNGVVDIIMTVLNEERPYMTSPNTVPYQDEDLSFTFELFGGTINTVSGLDITEDDYTINESTLTIKSTFIDQVIENDPDRETIIISYTLLKDDLTIVGFIFIEVN